MRPAGRQRILDLRRDREQLHGREEHRVAERRDLGAAARAARRGRSRTEPTTSIASVARSTSASRARRSRWRSSQRVSCASSCADHEPSVVARAGRVASRGARSWAQSRSIDEQVEFRVWAPTRGSARGPRRRSASTTLERDDDGTWSGTCPRADGDDYVFVVDGDAWPDPCSRSQPEGVRGPSRVVDTASFDIAPGPTLDARGARPLRAARRHVLERGNVRRSRPASARAARARRHCDRADAGRDVPRQPQLGLRRRSTPSRRTSLRRPGGARAARGRGAPRGPRRHPRRRLQPHRPRLRGDRRVRPVLHRRARHVLGRRDRLLAARRARMGDPERGAVDARLPDRRPAPRRRARDLRRSEPHVLDRAARPRRRHRHLGDEPRGPPAARRVGTRRDVARQPPPRAPRPADRRATGYYADFGSIDGLVRELQRARPGALRRVRAEPRPGRQPRASATGCRRTLHRVALACVLFSLAHAARVHGRGVRGAATRSRSSPTTSIPRSPRRRAKDACARSSGRPARRRTTRPIRRTSETFERSKLEPRDADPLLPRAARAALARCRASSTSRRREPRDA